MTPQELADRAKAKLQQQEDSIALTINHIEHYRNSFSTLLDDIEEWLMPFISNSTASISRIKFDLNDPTTKSRYEIESAEILIIGKKISLIPEYLYGMGHSCSVATSGFKQNVSFGKDKVNSSDWVITVRSLREATVLNESSFMKLIEPLVV